MRDPARSAPKGPMRGGASSSNPRRMLFSVVGAGLVLAACSPSPSGDRDDVSEYIAPGWMAQARQEVEAYQSAMMSCFAEFGVEGDPTPGGEVLVSYRGGEDGELAPGVEQLVENALTECSERVALPSLWTAPADADAYQRMLDSRDCLIAQGYEMPEPPSLDAWTESGFAAWNPYQELTGPDVPVQPSLAEIERLTRECPQVIQGATAFANGEDVG